MRLLVAAPLLLGLAGCGTLHWRAAAAPPLLAPDSYGGTARAQQRLTFSHGDQSHTLQGWLDVSPQRVQWVATTALGQRILSLNWDGRDLAAESALPEGALEPSRVLLDLQLAVWPLPALQRALAGTGWTATETAPGTRRVDQDGEPYAEIHYAGRDWRGRMWLVNWRGGYTLALDSTPG